MDKHRRNVLYLTERSFGGYCAPSGAVAHVTTCYCCGYVFKSMDAYNAHVDKAKAVCKTPTPDLLVSRNNRMPLTFLQGIHAASPAKYAHVKRATKAKKLASKAKKPAAK